MLMIEFLEDNGDISVTKFLQEHSYEGEDSEESEFDDSEESEFDEDENALMANDQ